MFALLKSALSNKSVVSNVVDKRQLRCNGQRVFPHKVLHMVLGLTAQLSGVKHDVNYRHKWHINFNTPAEEYRHARLRADDLAEELGFFPFLKCVVQCWPKMSVGCLILGLVLMPRIQISSLKR